VLQPNAPTQQRLINLPLQTTTRPIALPRARNHRLQPSPPTSETQIDPSPIQSSSRESSFLENQNVSNISFLLVQKNLLNIPLASLPPIEPFRPHTVRGLSPNTPAKRLFGDIANDQNPNQPIPSIESSSRSASVTPTALDRFPRSSSLLIKSLPNPLIQSPIDRSVREASSADLIIIVHSNPQPLNDVQNQPRRSARERKPANLGPSMVKYPEKGRMVLDPSSITIKEVVAGDRIACSAAERFRTGIVKIPNTHIEAMKSDFSDY
jgi:hypothetical protein